MKIMLVKGRETDDTCLEMIRQLGHGNIHSYQYDSNGFDKDFDGDQKYFDCIYSPDPKILLKVKPKIPYFYDIPSGRFNHELNYKVFDKYYSQLGGAKAVFVNDKKMNKYAHWSELNPYWVDSGIDLDKDYYQPKKFITPKLKIGYIFNYPENNQIVKDVFSAKKSNWEFHLYNSEGISQDGSVMYYDGNLELSKKSIYENCHVILNPTAPYRHSLLPVPSTVALEAMYSGCITISGNIHDNADHLLVDKYHYFKLDFIDANTIIETIRYADKRREKLERMSKAARSLITKYYDSKESAKKKLEIIQKHL